ncbi:uncharacterized protein LOC111386964 [Olea europaea var. sylvestris]|uniref:uncharacterized protein LOC111386964 n=1 Tax=Olea europaea var. sylvestris TaxID=158386 RepID=UPI000C1CF8E4|nr:uncharacterized protein LOC111386964 [Olea europaea var. sylvestris]
MQQCIDLFELIATTHSMFSSERVVPPKAVGIYKLDSTASTNAQIAALTKQVELLVKSQTKGAHAVIANPSYENCGANHLTKNCTSLGYSDEQINFIQNGSRNFNHFSQTYNLGWRQHPNFRWSDNQQGNSSNNAQQEKKPSLGEMFSQYMQNTDKVFQRIDTNFQNQQASIKKLETQIGQIAQQLAERPQGTLPSNTMVNPKEQVQAITTRSGVQLPEIHVKRPDRKDKEVIGEEAGTEAESHYAKFLKKILSNKRKLEEHEIVCMNEECSVRVNLMTLSVYRFLGLGEAKSITISLQLAKDQSNN